MTLLDGVLVKSRSLVSGCSLVTVAAAAVALSAAGASAQVDRATPAPSADPRVGLRAGWLDAQQAAWNLRLVSTTPQPEQFSNPSDRGDFGYMNSDLAFSGTHVIQGNFHGILVWDISQPAHPTVVTSFVCPEAQNDVSVYRNLLFVSGEDPNGRLDCGAQGVTDTVSHERLRGIRIFDISDIAHPKSLASVQTCRGSHTHTVVPDLRDTTNVYIYVSGQAPVRSPSELPGCSGASPDDDPSSARFRIEVIQVPLAHPEQAHIVSSPRIFTGLIEPPTHAEAPEDIAENKAQAAAWRAKGGYTVAMHGLEFQVGPRFITPMLDSIVKARGGTGAATAADSAALRENLQAIVDRRMAMMAPPAKPGAPRPGPDQCHDITVYPAIGLAAGACAGYGLLLDIRDPAHPRRLAAASDSNFAYWHSATFNNDGTKVLFTDEWGGGLQPRCRKTDRREWGADALFTRHDSTLVFQGYYKLPAPQTQYENCVAHNGSLIPVPGRDIMAQGWYQGGISVFDWTDPAHPKEIAFFDRGPMDSTKLVGAGSWSAYWYNGYLVSSEIARGLDILELQANSLLSQNEIDAAKLVHFDFLNVQNQPRETWPASFVVARAFVDQLERSGGLKAPRVAAVRGELAKTERLEGSARRGALTRLATGLDRDASTSSDAAKVRMLAGAVRELATAPATAP